MGTKTGLAIAAIGVAIAIHAHRKNKKAKLQASTSSQSSHGGHGMAYGAAALGAAGAGAYAAHHIGSSSPSSPPSTAAGNLNLRDASLIYHHLVEGVLDQKLQPFYPPGSPELQNIANRIAQSGSLQQIADQWDLPEAFALDIVRLALFDVALLVDDSTSMRTGSRVQEMQNVVSEIAYACGLFDDNGIEVRFMNSNDGANNIRNANDVQALLARNPPNGTTPMGRSCRDKILRPLVIDRARQNTLRKPVLCLILTDGAANDSAGNQIQQVIAQAKQELRNTRYTDNAISFAFAQVGDDRDAIEFLNDLDDDKTIGDMIDVTSNTAYETKQVLKALEKNSNGLPAGFSSIKSSMKDDRHLWETLFRLKRLVGGCHSWYDASDEKKSKKSSGWGSSSSMTYKPHWSEQSSFMAQSTAFHQRQGYPPYSPSSGSGGYQQSYGQQSQYGSRDTSYQNQSYPSQPPPAPMHSGYGQDYSGGYQQQNQFNSYNGGYNQPPPAQNYGPPQGYQAGGPQGFPSYDQQPQNTGGFMPGPPQQDYGYQNQQQQQQPYYQDQSQQNYGFQQPPNSNTYQGGAGGWTMPQP